MTLAPIVHPSEMASNAERASAFSYEPRALRTFTPTQAVLARSAGIYHWTPEGRRLYDFTSGVLVANLGHNPVPWTRRFFRYMGWPVDAGPTPGAAPVNGQPPKPAPSGYFSALPLTAYNAVTTVETEASKRLVAALRRATGGGRLHQVMWAASGSEAIQKGLWAGLARDRARPMIIATRYGFHGKKGLAGAVTGTEHDAERDPRVRFISFPMRECLDAANRNDAFDPAPYRKELDDLRKQFGRKLGVLITEPYLGGGGSFHPPKVYLQMLQQFCREMDIIFILDEVQSNFGRTGQMFAFETYELEPDVVVLGKGLGNGVPVAAAVGRKDLFNALDYGEGSDTWSANPLCCAAVLATLDEFESRDVVGEARKASAVIEAGLLRLKELPFVAHVRGENGGVVWGVETQDHAGHSAADWANAIVLACYRGENGGDGIHLLGPLAKKVIRIAPPVTIALAEARSAMDLFHRLLKPLVNVAQQAMTPVAAGSPVLIAMMPLADFDGRLLERWAQGLFGWHGYELGALLAVLLIGGISGMVGALVVGNRMAFFSDAMAHCAFAGISLGLLIALAMGFTPASEELQWLLPLIMAGFGALVGVGIAYVRENTGLSSDTVIGVFFAGAIGFGAMILQGFPGGRRTFDPERFLFGGPTLVQPLDLLVLAVLLVVTALIMVWRYNQFVLASFNPSLARSRGVPVALNNYLFVLMLALIVNFSISAVGVLLINALLIVPAAAASNVSATMRQMFRRTLGLSLGVALVGLFVSRSFELPIGPGPAKQFGVSGTIVCVGVIAFAGSMAYASVRRRFAALG